MTTAVADALDIIEIAFSVIEVLVYYSGSVPPEKLGVEQSSSEAIEELNFRFRQHRIGYEYIDGKLIRIDSQYLHEEAVKPAMGLLQHMAFAGPSEEFMKAHEHYRHRRNKEAMNEALKAFESTMKAICEARGWNCRPTATASELVQTLLDNDLVPTHLQAHFNALRSTLESGLPTLRNKQSGHGQGIQPVDVPDYLARYAINLAATNIVLLVEAHQLDQ